MGHLQSCYIRKNNEAIAKQLFDLGWHIEDIKSTNENDCIFCNLLNKELIDDFDKCFTYSQDFANRYFLNRKDCIDCGTNEDMFFAIAALDKHTDFGQWFVCDTTLFDDNNNLICKKGDWILCPQMSFYNYHFHGYCIDAHKASINEIINQFK